MHSSRYMHEKLSFCAGGALCAGSEAKFSITLAIKKLQSCPDNIVHNLQSVPPQNWREPPCFQGVIEMSVPRVTPSLYVTAQALRFQNKSTQTCLWKPTSPHYFPTH